MNRETCMCGLSVHLGCQIVIWFQLILAILCTPAAIAGIYLIASNDPNHITIEGVSEENVKLAYYGYLFGLWIMVVSNALTIVTSILLLYGYKKHRREFYTPYLVFTAASLVLLGIYIMLSVISGIYLSFKRDQYTQVNVAISFAYSATLITIMPFMIYFYYVVPRRSQRVHPTLPPPNSLPPYSISSNSSLSTSPPPYPTLNFPPPIPSHPFPVHPLPIHPIPIRPLPFHRFPIHPVPFHPHPFYPLYHYTPWPINLLCML